MILSTTLASPTSPNDVDNLANKISKDFPEWKEAVDTVISDWEARKLANPEAAYATLQGLVGGIMINAAMASFDGVQEPPTEFGNFLRS